MFCCSPSTQGVIIGRTPRRPVDAGTASEKKKERKRNQYERSQNDEVHCDEMAPEHPALLPNGQLVADVNLK